MHADLVDALSRRVASQPSRRAVLSIMGGAALGGLGASSPLTARKKHKKVKFCRDGETVKAKNKKKKKRLRKQGATRGACPACPDLQPTADLAAAIAAAAPGTTLRLCPGAFRLSSTLVVEHAVTLLGAGTDQTILDGGNAMTVLQSDSADPVIVQDLTITRGRAPAAADRGGGILNQGSLTLRGVAITDCSAASGGAIFNQIGTLRLEAGSRLTGNSATNGGGIFSQAGTVALAATSVTGNTADNGGGIFSQGATTTLETGSTVGDNDVGGLGGGIFMQSGTVTLRAGSAVTGNTAGGIGGGILNQGGLGTLTLDAGSTVSVNTPDNCDPDQGACV
jgi:putative cofactor-binding repeat protein